MDNNHTTSGLATCVAETAQFSRPAPKWAATVDDQIVFAPSQHVLERVLKEQPETPEGHILVRDHGSEHDVAVHDGELLDLAKGNVFFSVPRCEYSPRGGSPAPPKLAWFVNDRWEVTLRENQTVQSLRDLFGLTEQDHLLRDRESPHDEIIEGEAEVCFRDGPVFITRGCHHAATVSITINGTEYQVPAGNYSVEHIKVIPKPRIPVEDTLSQVVDNKIVPLANDTTVQVRGHEVFVSNCPSGGAS